MERYVSRLSLTDTWCPSRSFWDLGCDWIISVKWQRDSGDLENSLNNLFVAEDFSKRTVYFHHAYHSP